MMDNVESAERPLQPLTPRQEELIRIIQGLPAEQRHSLKIICRGAEPWEIEKVVEHRKVDIRPRQK